MISLEKWQILTPLHKLPKNVSDLAKIIFATGFESCNKSPNLVTLPLAHETCRSGINVIKYFFAGNLENLDFALAWSNKNKPV